MPNLRQIDAVSEYSSSTGPTWSRFSAVDFHVRSSIIGNLGELLDHDSTNDPTAASTSDQSQATDSSTAYTNANTQDASPSKSDDIQEVRTIILLRLIKSIPHTSCSRYCEKPSRSFYYIRTHRFPKNVQYVYIHVQATVIIGV